MALNKAGLKAELKAAIETAYGKPADDSATLEKFCQAVANAVIDHIVTNTVITLTAGDVPVQVSLGTGIGANTAHAPLTGKIS